MRNEALCQQQTESEPEENILRQTWYNEETEEWDSQVTIEGQLIPFDWGGICPTESMALVKAISTLGLWSNNLNND